MKNLFRSLFTTNDHYLLDVFIDLAGGVRTVEFLCTREDGNESDYYFEDRFQNNTEVKDLPYLEEQYNFHSVSFVKEYTFNAYFPGLSSSSPLVNKLVAGWWTNIFMTRYFLPKVSLRFTLWFPINPSFEKACEIAEGIDKTRIANKIIQYKGRRVSYDRELTLEYDFVIRSIRELYDYINFTDNLEDVVRVGYLGDLLPFSLGKEGFIVDKDGRMSFFCNGNLWACGTQEHKKEFTFDEIANILFLTSKKTEEFGNKTYQIFST